MLKKGFAVLVALALLLLVVWLAGTYDFWSAFAVGYGMWFIIDWYDCFLDWVLFANMRSVRLYRGLNTWTLHITKRNTTSYNPVGAC